MLCLCSLCFISCKNFQLLIDPTLGKTSRAMNASENMLPRFCADVSLQLTNVIFLFPKRHPQR